MKLLAVVAIAALLAAIGIRELLRWALPDDETIGRRPLPNVDWTGW